MSKLSSFVALTLVAIGGISPAMAKEEADPAVYLAAFNDTCRRGFPDLDKIAAHAQSIGWAVRKCVGRMGWLTFFPTGHRPFAPFTRTA